MESLKAIKKRINTVKNTQKITKAMKMVAAAKLRRAQMAAHGSRDYLNFISQLAGRLVANYEGEPHPLMRKKEEVKHREYLILTSDRGLCGGFNSNLLRKVEAEFAQAKEKGIVV